MVHIFIVNTNAGDGKFSEQLRKSLSKIENFEYFIFNTRKKEKEGQLIKKVISYFKGEKLRIYSCGGSGTFRNILNSIDDPQNVELAFYPCGMSNDFLKIFDDDESFFHNIENLINGEVRMIDYIETNHGRALNSFSIGMDTDTLLGMERYRPYSTISGKIPYFLSIIYALFGVKCYEYEITIDGEVNSGNHFEIFFGNGCTIGGNVKFGIEKSADNGIANIYIGPKVNPLTILPFVMFTTSGKPEKTLKHGAKISTAKTISIRRTDNTPIIMNFDGELADSHEYWEAKIVHKGLPFVVPKQVSKGFAQEVDENE